MTPFRRLFQIKPIDSELPPSERPLKRVLGPVDLVLLGIGGIVGPRIKENAWFNAAMVGINLLVLGFFVVTGACR